MAEKQKEKISYGSLREFEWLESRNNPENCQTINISELAKAFEKFDPGGRQAHELAKKYSKKDPNMDQS